MSNLRYLWAFILTLFLTACSSGDCDKPCRQSDSCPDFSGSYTVSGSVMLNQCSINYNASLVVQVSAFAGADGTDIDIVLGNVSLKGRVCNTNRVNYPLTYDFSATATSVSGDTSIIDSLSGQFVVNDGGAKSICANYSHQENAQKESCRDLLLVSSSSSVCQ